MKTKYHRLVLEEGRFVPVREETFEEVYARIKQGATPLRAKTVAIHVEGDDRNFLSLDATSDRYFGVKR